MSDNKGDKTKKPTNKKKNETDKKKNEPEKKPVKKMPASLLAKIKADKDRLEAVEMERQRLIKEEEEKIKLLEAKKAEEERLKREKKERKKQKEKEKKEREKSEGTYMTEKEKKKLKEERARRGIDLEHGNDSTNEVKKVIYGKIKKKVEKLNKIDDDGEIEQKDDDKQEVDENNENLNEEASDSDASFDNWEKRAEAEEISSKKNSEKPEVRIQKEEFPSKIIPNDKTKVIVKTKEEEEQERMEIIQKCIGDKHLEHEAKRDVTKLRAPIVCVLGHVDTGKTSLLDNLRKTDVQGGETGGITQQMGATNIPIQNIPSVIRALPNLILPGLLIIDTPGHESFSNMRSRGSSLCDLAVLVVDLMHGVEEQTKESIKLLRKGKVPFVVALNKIDRLVNWKKDVDRPIKDLIDSQSPNTKAHFQDQLNQVVVHFATCEVNVRCFWEEDDDEDYVSMVPTSAHTGDGMGDLIAYLCKMSQMKLAKRLAFSEELQASVMEVKETPGHGTTLDVILVNGRLRANDTIVLGGQEGPITTKIRYLLKPAPMAELRVKGQYTKENECMAAQGIKVVAKDLEMAMPGLPVYVAHSEDEAAYYRQDLSAGLDALLRAIKVADVGLFVQTSTIGSMEALLTFLRQQKVPFAGINIGPVHKKDVVRAAAMREREPKWAVMLVFNVRVEPEAEIHARANGVTIFRQEIIYKLFDDLTAYLENLMVQNKERLKDQVVFPVSLRILPDNIFQKRNPILCGVSVEEGTLRLGTPLFVVADGVVVPIGKAMSLEINKHSVSEAKTGQEVCVRIDPFQGEAPRTLGRHFKETDPVYSRITRESIDILKQYYRDVMTPDDWKLTVKLKEILNIR